MSLLANLFRQWKKHPNAADSTSLAPSESAPGSGVTYRQIAGRFKQLCADGALHDAFELFLTVNVKVRRPDEALQWIDELVLPYLLACLAQKNPNAACDFEGYAYGQLIRAFELPAHYEACFAALDDALYSLGSAMREQHWRVATVPTAARRGRLLFFIQNVSSAAAHIPLLCDVLDAYLEVNPSTAPSIAITGTLHEAYAPRLIELAESRGVGLFSTPDKNGLCSAYEMAVRLVEDGQFDRLVVCAMPVGLSYLSGRLPAERLAWFTMKFELNCFAHLAHRCSIISSLEVAASTAERKRWLQAPPFLMRAVALSPSTHLPPIVARARRHETLLYTINREQKIRNPDFLAAVADVLEKVPGACFVWTGQERLAEIDAYFDQRDLLPRTYFAGWVNPDDLIAAGDVFLDTPVLSGTVAARAAAAGRPLVTFARSQSWINVYGQVHAADVKAGAAPLGLIPAVHGGTDASFPFEFATHDEYVSAAIRLAREPDFRLAYGKALGAFAARYFFDRTRWAAQHISHMREGL